MTTRIWWQSFSAPEWAGAYWEYLTHHLNDVLDGLAKVELHGLPAETFGPYPPISLLGNPYAAHRLMQDIPERARTAQDQGYSAFILGSYSEPHLRVMRSYVDITVASVAESTLLAACTAAGRIGIVSITGQLRRMTQDTVDRHGLGSRVAHIAVMDPLVMEHELVAAFDDPRAIVERFEAAAAECVRAGADIVIPGEGILSEVLHSAGVTESAGAVVVDCVGVTALHTIFQLAAARRANLRPGRVWSYPSLDPEKSEFVSKYRSRVGEGVRDV